MPPPPGVEYITYTPSHASNPLPIGSSLQSFQGAELQRQERLVKAQLLDSFKQGGGGGGGPSSSSSSKSSGGGGSGGLLPSLLPPAAGKKKKKKRLKIKKKARGTM